VHRAVVALAGDRLADVRVRLRGGRVVRIEASLREAAG
jgi:hypothetical protein